MNQIFDADIKVLETWAESNKCIRKVIIFGSRAKGTATLESDLDVAIELEPMGYDEDAFTTYTAECDNWCRELQPRLSCSLQLHFLDAQESPRSVINQGVENGSIVIYESGE